MPEGSQSALHQGPMGEETPQLSPPLSNSEHVHRSIDLDPDCCGQVCMERLDREGDRPVSLVSTLSSGSSHDSRSIFGSTVALPSSNMPLMPGEEDIDLELSPAEGSRDKSGSPSPTLTGSRGCWEEQLEPRQTKNQWNNNNAIANRDSSSGITHILDSPVITGTMAPNPKLTFVDRVVMEIIETERMYVKDLRSIVEDYLAHIIDMGNLPIRPEQVCALFGNIEDIYEFNSELLQSLDMCENDPVAVAQCFVNKSEYFEIYTQYCTNYPNSVAALTDCMRSKTLEKFFRERQAALKRSLPLGSYLLKPVQRILKYHLLLQEIAKHFDSDEEGYDVVQEAIDTMTGVAWYINDMKRKHEHAVRVQEIQSLLINWKGADLTTYGELVLEGTFHVLRAKNTRTLFLFEKMLLITKKRGEHYVYKSHISCSTLMLLDSAKDPLLFSVIHFKRPKQPHTVQAKSVEEKRLWAHHIKRLILENHNTIVPPRTKEAILDNSNYPGKYQSSPERLKKADSCQEQDFHLGGRNGRRRSEPVKQIRRSSKVVLKHADSEGALLGDRCSLQQAPSVSTLASSLAETQAERPCVEGLLLRGDSLEALNPIDIDPRLGSSPSKEGLEQQQEEEDEEEEGEGYAEDLLMGEDQDDHNGDTPDVKTRPGEEAEICRRVEKQGDEAVKESDTQVSVQELCPLECDPEVKKSNQLQVLHCQYPKTPSKEDGETPEPQDSPREAGEDEGGGSDSSGLQVEEVSVLSEEEEEVLSLNKSILPSSVLDQASVIAEHFIGSLSRRSSLVSEELGSLSCPPQSLNNDPVKSPSPYIDLKKQPELLGSSAPVPQATSEANVSATEHKPVPNTPTDEERRSTLSKQDRLLIHKIRQYYEHAEHQDASFSIKRRESLSYIPAGLVRHLSRQLTNNPDAEEEVVPVHRRGFGQNRPTSWAVFDLPGIEKSQNTEIEPQKSVPAKARSHSVTEASTAEEEFRPSSEMLKVWQDMESEEENRDIQQIAEENDNDSSLEVAPNINSDSSDVKTSKKPLQILQESEVSTATDSSHITSPNITPQAVEENSKVSQSQLPKIIGLRSSMDEDQILQDMGKMKNKVFQLARQYSQRIKNNRPIIWQKNRDTENQESFKNGPTVHEEKMQFRNRGKPNLRLSLKVCDQEVIHEVRSPSPVQTPSSGTSSQNTVIGSQTPQTETFLWPDVQELRSKYSKTSHSSRMTHSCTVPNEIDICNGCSHKYNSSSDLHTSPTDSLRKQPESEDWPQHRAKPRLNSLLCRWSSLDHMLGSLPSHEVENLQKPVRTCLEDGDNLQEALDGTAKSEKTSESNLVKSLRDKFQSLSTSS